MSLGHPKRAVGIFPDYQSAEVALGELQAAGFPMHKVSVIASDVSRRNWFPGINVRDRFDNLTFGFPQDRASVYQNRLTRGHYLVAVEGTAEEIHRAESILSRRGIQDWGIYDIPDGRQNLAGAGSQRRAVGVFPNRRDAENALHELKNSGFPMNRVAVIVKDADRDDQIAGAQVSDRVDNKAEEGAAVGAVSGGVLGGLTGLLVGLGTLAIPGIGPIMLAGATATTIATTLAGGAIGAVAGSLLGALVGLGIPEERARVYSERVARGQYLVIVDGTVEEIAKAEAILSHRGIEEYGVYDAPYVAEVPTAEPRTTTTGVPATGFGNKYAVGLFPHLRDAELAIDDLRNAGFPLNQIFLSAENFERRERFTGIDLRDRFDAMRIGLPDERARFYNDRLKRGDYVVTVNGTEDEIRHAAAILSNRGIQEWQVYDPTAIDSTLPSYAASTPNTPTGIGSTLPNRTASTPTSGLTDRALGKHKRAIGVFPYRRDAEAAITELKDSGFPLSNVSVIAKDADHNNPIAGVNTTPGVGNKADEGAKAGAATGGALGGLGGLLVGLGTLAIPGVGPIVLGGAAATAIATAISGGAIGAAAGGIVGALAGLGIPEERARVYNDRLTRGHYLVIVDGTEDEIRRAEAILNHRGIQDFGIYDVSDVDTTRGDFSRVDRDVTSGIHPRGSDHPDVTIVDHRDAAL